MALKTFLRPIPHYPLEAQIAAAVREGIVFGDQQPVYEDTAHTFPERRDSLLASLRAGASDVIWVYALPVLAQNRADLKALITRFGEMGVTIWEGGTGRRTPSEAMLLDCLDYWTNRNRPFSNPEVAKLSGAKGRAKRAKPEDGRMPHSAAEKIWGGLGTIAEKVAKMNGDPRWPNGGWSASSAYAAFGKSGGNPGRPVKLTETDE